MTAEQLEELLGLREKGFRISLDNEEAVNIIKRVIAAEKLVREVRHYTYGNAPLHFLRSALTAYREASKGATPQ
mgnify:CR=1 FL=1